MLKMFRIKLVTDGRSTWSVFKATQKRHKTSMRGELPRTGLKLEPEVDRSLEEAKFKHRKHPGRFVPSSTHLPDQFVDAARVLLQDHPKDQMLTQAKALSQYLFSRKAPVEAEEWVDKAKAVEEKILQQNPKLANIPVNEDDFAMREKKLKELVRRRMMAVTYHWNPINYDGTKALLYLLGRAAPEYAVLTSIFREIRLRNEQFRPESVFDFGSGVGTVFWASYEQWGKKMKEYFAVDISSNMNNVAQLLVQDGSETKSPILKSTFFRQFLPASQLLTYDLVVSAYSLMELPSRKLRLETLENLWSKTSEFLVIVEQGTNAGYKLILEAREFILQTSAVDAHVFAPCSHDLECPKVPIGVPCNFEAGYSQLHAKLEDKLMERYCYVVLRKRRRPVGLPWPRLVAEVLPRGKHVVCRMCCSDGSLKEAVVTASKNGKSMYKCARASQWGDLLPAANIDLETGTGDERAIMEKYLNDEESESEPDEETKK